MAQPLQYPTTPPPPTAPPPRNGLGTAGFVLGLIGLIFSPIPIIGVVAWPLVILGLIFSLIGLRRAGNRLATNRGLAIAGLVCSAVGLAICILWAVAFGKAANDIRNESNREATIRYEVTGNTPGATITYSTWGDTLTQNQETAATLPWTKELKVKGLLKGGTLTVTAPPTGGTISCKVTIDGNETKTATATGPFATASCTGF
ncbi:MAG TPA: DUF4190 domain-containing protein [Actinophytocola sp.]|jgi:hypothetical protein|uniref:DUF4190 domain-containing protein n=1 Tax=Actinophytocola sp. TaxID=1872138 RepID=UPI002E079D5D|nr:DUF4190 domain-containing protein [Actinophytocola sp.]